LKIVAINGSRRKRGNTAILIETILAPAIQAGADIEMVSLGDYAIGACTGCEGCRDSWECVIKDDFATLVEKMDAADGIILASPTYWYTVTSDMKRFVDRCYSLVQFPKSRSAWIGKYDETGKKCIAAAVCEQHDEAHMGNTLMLLADFSRDIGLNVIASLKALRCFEAGSIQKEHALLKEAQLAGRLLVKS
jgi:multimeric flavodoxin WrbA